MAMLVSGRYGPTKVALMHQNTKKTEVSDFDFGGLPNELLQIVAVYAGSDATKLWQIFSRIQEAIPKNILPFVTGDAQDGCIVPGDAALWTDKDRKVVEKFTKCNYYAPLMRYRAKVVPAPKITITIPQEFSRVSILRLQMSEDLSKRNVPSCLELPQSITTLVLRGHDGRDYPITFAKNVQITEVFVCSCTLGGSWETCPIFPPSVLKVNFSACRKCEDWSRAPDAKPGESIEKQGFTKISNLKEKTDTKLYYRATTLKAVLAVLAAFSKLKIL